MPRSGEAEHSLQVNEFRAGLENMIRMWLRLIPGPAMFKSQPSVGLLDRRRGSQPTFSGSRALNWRKGINPVGHTETQWLSRFGLKCNLIALYDKALPNALDHAGLARGRVIAMRSHALPVDNFADALCFEFCVSTAAWLSQSDAT